MTSTEPPVVRIAAPPASSVALLQATLVEALRARGYRTASVERRPGGLTVTLPSGGRIGVERDVEPAQLGAFVATLDPRVDLALALDLDDALTAIEVISEDGALLASIEDAELAASLQTGAPSSVVERLAEVIDERALAGGAEEQPAAARLRGSRRLAVVVVKLVHTTIFVTVSAAIFKVLVDGLRGRWTRGTRVALALSVGESALVLANRMRCPLTALAERLGAEDGRVSDIFLPRWLADRIPLLCGTPLVVGLLAIAWRRLGRRR